MVCIVPFQQNAFGVEKRNEKMTLSSNNDENEGTKKSASSY